jgi:hypothetical protein
MQDPGFIDLDKLLLDERADIVKHDEDPDLMNMEDLLKNNLSASYKSLFIQRVLPNRGGPVYKMDQQAQ